MSDYDFMEKHIRESGYEPKTSTDNLINMIFLHFDSPDIEEEGYKRYDEQGFFNIKECLRYVEESGGYAEFDWVV